MEVNGYKYTTEQEAINAREACDTYYGYPKSNSVTEHWCGYQYGFWYIIYDQSIEVVLGQPENFDITIPDLN
jgi:hypothetical protein